MALSAQQAGALKIKSYWKFFPLSRNGGMGGGGGVNRNNAYVDYLFMHSCCHCKSEFVEDGEALIVRGKCRCS